MRNSNIKDSINQSRGVLHQQSSQSHYRLQRLLPDERLAPFIEQYWFVEWSLDKGKSHTQQNLPDPTIHITVENGLTQVYGPVKQRFSRTLSKSGNIFGIKFQAGAFHCIFKQSISKLCDQSIPLNRIFLDTDLSVFDQIGNTQDLEQKAKLSNHFFQRLFEPDSEVSINDLPHSLAQLEKIKRLISTINSQQHITKVEALCDQLAISHRSLQRLCRDYLGLSPKWLIRKYRLQEILARLEDESNSSVDWQQYVSDLDYSDQAHFVKDFKSFTGFTPQDYLAKA